MPSAEPLATIAEIDPSPIIVPHCEEINLASALNEPNWPLGPNAALVLQQFWLPNPEAQFQPATVWFGATDAAFLFFAVLADREIRTSAANDHELLWKLGDTFQIMLQPYGGDGSFDYQVAPNGRLLQLHYPEIATSRHDELGRYIHQTPILETCVRVEPERERWRVAARLPIAPLLGNRPRVRSDEWRIAFCRHDYDGAGRVRLSSSALLKRPDFRRVGEWARIKVPGGFAGDALVRR